MLTNCLAACAHLTITVSEIARGIYEKIVILSYPLAFDAPVRGFPSEYRHPFGMEKLEWCRYPMVKKFRRYVYSFWRDPRTWRTYGRTDTAWQERPRLCIASRGKKSLCLRIGPRHNAKCSNIIARDSKIISWLNTIRYLGVNVVAGHKFACSLDSCKRSLYIAHLMLFLARWVGSHRKTS